jgi:ATP-binding cassette subfamily B protein
MRPDAWAFALALALTPAVAALGVAQPLLMKRVMDDFVTAGQTAGLGSAAGRYLLAVIGAFACESVYTLLLARAAENTIFRLRGAIFRHTLGLSQRFFERQPTGQLMTRATSDIDALNDALMAGSVSMLLDILVMLGTLGAMLALDWRLTCLLLLVGPVVAGVVEFARRRMRKLFAEIRDALAALNTFAAERLAGVEVLQMHGLEARSQARFRALDERHRDANVANNLYDAGLYAFIDGLASICIAMMLAYGARQRVADAVTVGLVVAFVDYIERMFRPLRELSGKIVFLQRAQTALDKIFWLLGVDERITPGSRRLAAAEGRLSLRDVCFRYREDGPAILDHVTLDVAPGEVVAVVGRTGSGKSTLVRLLARVHDGYQGSIQVDGAELRDIEPESVRRAIASVRQEVQLFTDTLRFNVTLGDAGLDPARVDEAVRLSNAHRVAERYPEGLDHPLRERGAELSAGEGQIVALARALARDPALIILDEATASVDPVTEQLLQEAIERVFARKTCLVIAHRLSTITRADRIVVLDAGRVMESGTHAELLALGGRYAALYREGFGGAEPGRERSVG